MLIITNEQLLKEMSRETGFWVRLNDINNEYRTGIAAKIIIKDEQLTLFTLLDDAPAINVYDSEDFSFISKSKKTILILNKKGRIYDWWEEDCDRSAEEYTKSFLSTWDLDEEEYNKFSGLGEVDKLPELLISGLIQE